MANLKHKDRLLLDIAKGCEKFLRTNIANVRVIFTSPSGEYDFSLTVALEVIANDLYWDGRGNWAEAQTARVETF